MFEGAKITAPAKLNLRLKVEGRRTDGFHLLSMLNVLVGLFDQIELTETPTNFSISTELAAGVSGDPSLYSVGKNLASKSAAAFYQAFGLEGGISIRLKKNIPLGSGLGGGSSDAASVLRFLEGQYRNILVTQYGLAPSVIAETVLSIALNLGADVPYFLYGGLAHVSGVGELVKPLGNCFTGDEALLLVPNCKVATAGLYAEYRKRTSEESFSEDRELRKFLALGSELKRETIIKFISNDFQNLVSELYPEVRELLLELKGEEGVLFSLTGSGSAVFCMEIQPEAVRGYRNWAKGIIGKG